MSNKRLTTGLGLLLLAFAVTNVLLIRQNLQMRRTLEGLQQHGPTVGDKLPAFKAIGLDGELIEVGYTGDGPRKVLLYFTPTCRFCREQFAHWREVIRQADKRRFEVLGVVSQSEDRPALEEYLRKMGCGPDSQTPLRVGVVSHEMRGRYGLSATPVTLVMANDGTLEKSWAGAWDAGEKADAGLLLGLDPPPIDAR